MYVFIIGTVQTSLGRIKHRYTQENIHKHKAYNILVYSWGVCVCCVYVRACVTICTHVCMSTILHNLASNFFNECLGQRL